LCKYVKIIGYDAIDTAVRSYWWNNLAVLMIEISGEKADVYEISRMKLDYKKIN